jgi:hypothetical protein
MFVTRHEKAEQNDRFGSIGDIGGQICAADKKMDAGALRRLMNGMPPHWRLQSIT